MQSSSGAGAKRGKYWHGALFMLKAEHERGKRLDRNVAGGWGGREKHLQYCVEEGNEVVLVPQPLREVREYGRLEGRDLGGAAR